jgi:hypothetical protein
MPRTKKDKDEFSEEEFSKELRKVWAEEEKSYRRRRKKHLPGPKKRTFLLAIAVNLFLWYLFDRYFVGFVPYVTLKFFTVLSFLKAALAVNILANFFLLFHSGRKFHHFARLSQSLFAMLFFYHFYLVFPFDFSSLAGGSSIDLAVKIGLVVAMVSAGTATIIQFLEMLLGK